MTLGDAPLFDHVLNSFAAYYASDEFLFVLRDADAVDFVRERCQHLRIARPKLVALGQATSGQAESVRLGLDHSQVADHQALAIFNIDTIRPGFAKPHFMQNPACDGYLEVFRGSGDGWSYVAPEPLHPSAVTYVTEKQPISDLCCTGLYYFRRAGDFRWAYDHPPPPMNIFEKRERYVAPLYNALISRGEKIDWHLIAPDAVRFCGTPAEYEQVAASFAKKQGLQQ
jgi:hypothetical protein